MNASSAVPSVLGGIVTVPPNQRMPHELEGCLNVDLDPSSGGRFRSGTNFVPFGGELGSIMPAVDLGSVHWFWIIRSSEEQYVGVIDPEANDNTILRIFDLEGNAMTVEGPTGQALGHADNAGLRAYLQAGTLDARKRFRLQSVEDTTFILNREVVTALTGRPITYRSVSTMAVRNQNNPQNVVSWGDFTHPPVTVGTPSSIPTGTPDQSNTDFTSDAIWYAQEDDLGWPQGFYMAVSTSQPPWFERVRTEPRNSLVDASTMPHRLSFDGTKFVLDVCPWVPRYSGDSTTNPGPSFIGNAISDMVFHQARLWFCSGQRLVSSRLDSIFDLWISSVSLVTDTDPIDIGLLGGQRSVILFMETYRESIIALTSGARQIEVRANGPLTPGSVMVYDSTAVDSVDYVWPVKMGSQVYFFGERDFSNTLWEYYYSPTDVNNQAQDITSRQRGLIPAQASLIEASEADGQLFVLTDALPNRIYTNRSVWNQGQKALNSWSIWEYSGSVLSIRAADSRLYMVIERDGLVFLEWQSLGAPQQDTAGDPPQTLSYQVRLDRRTTVQGFYDAEDNTTTFTLPYAPDPDLLQIILGPTWDAGDERLAGAEVVDVLDITDNVIIVEGQYEFNADSVSAPAILGESYEWEITLSRSFVRDNQGAPAHGSFQLLRGRVIATETGSFGVRIQHAGRDPVTANYHLPSVGSTALDSEAITAEAYHEFRILGNSASTTISFYGSSPTPTTILGCEIEGDYNRTHSPVRR